MKLPWSIPSTESIADLKTSRICTAMRENINVAFGISGDKTKRFITANDLQTLGLANVDSSGVLTNKTASSSSSSSSKTSSSNNRVSISCKVPMSGWIVGANYIDISVPQYAVVMNGWYYVDIQPTSAGAATIQLGIDTDAIAGLLAPTLVSDAVWAIGSHALITNGSAATFLTPATGYRAVVATVAVDTILTGNMTFYLEYFLT